MLWWCQLIITACCVLHNIAIMFREPADFDTLEVDEIDFDIQDIYHGPENGRAVRYESVILVDLGIQ